jgi:hypothetical protein
MADRASSRGRGRRVVVRRIGAAALAAVLVTIVASRVNKPARLLVLDDFPRAADVVLADVTIDMTSLPAAVESIRKAAPGGAVVVDAGSPLGPSYKPPGPPSLRVRNVRVGTALSIVFDHFRGGSVESQEFRTEPGRVVVGGPGAAWNEAFGKVYDVRDLLAAAQGAGYPTAYQTTLAAPPGALTYKVWAGEGELLAAIVAERDAPSYGSNSAWCAHAWAGRLFVAADANGHRDVEHLLMLLRLKTASRGSSNGGAP